MQSKKLKWFLTNMIFESSKNKSTSKMFRVRIQFFTVFRKPKFSLSAAYHIFAKGNAM